MTEDVKISFKKLEKVLESKGKRWQYLRDAKISPGIVAKLKDGSGHIDTRTIQKICELLGCQPGQIMEYIPESKKASTDDKSK
jgi:DNA-binding Xre family transcriptional regulator